MLFHFMVMEILDEVVLKIELFDKTHVLPNIDTT